MAANDWEIFGPFIPEETSTIIAGLTATTVLAADNVETYMHKGLLYILVGRTA